MAVASHQRPDGLARWRSMTIAKTKLANAAPAMHCVNAIPYVCEAAPGIKTYLDLPLIAGRAHQP